MTPALTQAGPAVVGLTGRYALRALFRTLRVQSTGQHHVVSLRQKGTPVIFVFWHGRLLPLVHVHRSEGTVVLVSKHHDGDYVAGLLRHFGFGTVRGSSTRGGVQGLKGLIRAAHKGLDLAITPDGPRGPNRELKLGALTAARITGLPLVPIGVGVTSAWRAGSWDELVVPKPFSTVHVAYGRPRFVPRHADQAEIDEVAGSLESGLIELAAQVGDTAPWGRPEDAGPSGPRRRNRRQSRSLVRGLRGGLRRSWDGQSGPLGRLMIGLFLPAEALYRGAVFLRNRCYDLGILPESESGIPIISVGNLAVGGTGKTPVASWLLTRLTTMGHRPALVTRGYGSDEVLFYGVRNPGVPVVVQKSKIQGVAKAAREGATVAVLDDGFQHRAARRDVDIVLLAAEQGGEGPFLPRGRFREPLSALSRADAIVITRKVVTRNEACAVGRRALRGAPDAALGQIHLAGDVWTELEGDPPAEAHGGPPGGDLLAVCSIAEPEGFHEMVRSKASGVVECMAFPDHHPFSDREVRRIVERAGGRPVVMTEKDAVKLRTFSKEMPETYVLRLRVAWDFGQDAVMELVRRALEGS